MEDTKIILSEKEMPQRWYNIIPDLPRPLPPPLNPGTGQPAKPEDFLPIFPMELKKREMGPEPWIDIPGEGQRG